MNQRNRLVILGLTLGLVSGCARARMQEAATLVADSVDELRAGVETQQLIRTELARTGAERLARSEAEVATREAGRAAVRAKLSRAGEALLRHSQAVAESADPRFAPTIAREVERREISVEYRRHVDDLRALAHLLERLAKGAVREDVRIYLELGAAAAQAAESAWTQAEGGQP
jgi:hypothetical protein